MRATPWDAAAARYPGQEHLEGRAIAQALDFAATQPRDRLLDVATGTGLLLRTLAARPIRPTHAVGLDSSTAMLARVGALPVGWSIVRGDARALPFDPSSFDIVAAAYLLHLLSRPDRLTVLGELRRVLRPQGRLVVATVWSTRRAARALLAGTAPAFLGGLRPLDPRPDLQASGFEIVRAAFKRGGYPSLVVQARRHSL